MYYLRTKRAIYNIVTSVVLQISSIVIGFVIPKLMIQHYGSTINGLVSSINQFITYFNILEGGVSVAAAVALYKPLAQGDKNKINSILSAVRSFYIKSGSVFILLSLLLSIGFPLLVQDQVTYSTAFLMVLILSLGSIYNYFISGKYGILYVADQKFYILNIINISFRTVGAIIQYFLIINDTSIFLVQLVLLASIVLRIVPTILYVKKMYPYINFLSFPDKLSLNQKWDALIIQIAQMITKNSPIFILTIFFDLKSVSVYSIYALIFHTGSSFFEILSNSLSSGFGNVYASGNYELLKKIYNISEYVVFSVCAIMSACFYIMFIPFVKLYLGNASDANYIVPMLAISFIITEAINNIRFSAKTVVMAAGHIKQTKNIAIIETIICIVFNTIAALNYGIIGVLVGSILGSACRTCYLLWYAANKILNQTLTNTITRLVRNSILVGIVLVPFMLVKIDATSYFELVENALLVGLWSLLVVGIGNVVADYATTRALVLQIKKVR